MKKIILIGWLSRNSHEKQSPQRFARYAAMLIMLLTLGVRQMWGDNEYNKRYLYVNSSNCNWWTNDLSQPALDAYWSNSDFSDSEKGGYKTEADGELTSTSWYFDLSTMNASFLYFRGFKVQRHPKNTNNYWNAVTLGAENNGTHNCLWINSDGNGMSWGNYAVPISSISLTASAGYLSGTGTSEDPYLVALGTNITLSAAPTFTPADATMQFCANFGTSPSANPTTERSSGTYTVSSTTKTAVKCVGRNKYGDVYSADVTSSSVYVQGVEPTVGVAAAGSITTTTATLNATVTLNGATTTAYGFKYGTVNNASTLQSSGTTASTSGALAANATTFNKGVTGLTENTTYYYISYVTTSQRTYYSASTQSFTTLSAAEETHNVTVSYKYGDTSIKDNTTESSVGVETSRSVTAPTITGYTFSSWTLGDGLTNKSANTTTNPISIVTKASGSFTLTANYTLNSHNVIFNANGGSGSMSNESFNYNQTKALTANTLTRTGYVFKGWATSSANATAGTIDYTDGADYTMGDADVTLYAVWYKKVYFVNAGNWTAANVKAHIFTGSTAWKTWNHSDEVMTSTGTTVFGYTIYSYEFPETYTTVIFHNNGDSETQTADQTWTAATPYCYYKSGAGTQYASVAAIREAWKVYGSWNMTGENWNSNDFASYGESTATYTVSLAAATTYKFQYVYAGTNTWHGCGGGTMSDGDTWTLNGNSDVTFTTTVAGTYTFTIDYSALSSNTGHPSCTLTFPTTYTVNFGVSPAGAANAPTNDKSISNGGLVLSGTSVTFTHEEANTGYTWSHWDVGGENVGTGDTYEATIDAATTVTAVYIENSYSTNVAVSPAGKGSITSPTPAEGKINVSHHTGTSVTATPNTNYVFESWSVTDGGLAVKSPSTLTSNPATFTATNAGGTITANFADQWAVCGIGNWSTYNGLPWMSGTVYEGTINLTAGSHSFKVVDRDANTWYTEPSKTITRFANTASATTTEGEGNNITITADKAGDYIFTFDTEDQSLTVTYPVDPTYTVTVTAGAHGSITTPEGGTVSAGEFTPAAIVAVADEGYVFSRWTVTDGNSSDVTITDATAASTTITATGVVTLTATFISTWAITGSSTTFGEWSTTAFGFSNFGTNASSKDTCYIEFDLPANTNFTFKIYNHKGTGDKWYGNSTTSTNYMTYVANNDQNWEFHEGNSYKDCGLTTAGAGTYRFIWNITDGMLRVRFPESYTVTYGKVADNGQDIGGVTATDDDGATLESGKYVAKGSATFTAAEAANYTFVDWRTSNVYGGGEQLSTENPYTMNSIAENKTVYAHYAENMTTVTLAHTGNGSIKIGEDVVTSTTVGTVTTCSITAVPDEGWYFAGWTVSDGADCAVASTDGRDDNGTQTTTLSGLGAGTTGTVTANFVENDKIYFRNIFDDGAGNVSRWSDVYVYFAITWNTGKVHSNSNSSYIAHMSQIAGEDVYWAYVPRSFTTLADATLKKQIAFSDTEFTTNYDFYNATESGSKAASRGDYHRSLNMFVPYHTAKSTNVNGVDYFDNGYWMKYDTRADQGAGYYLKLYNGRNDYTQLHELEATNDDATAIQYAWRTDASNTTKSFMITSAGGLNYIADNAISTSNKSNVGVSENLSDLSSEEVKFDVAISSQGIYTFVLDQSGDKMKLTVIYPIEVGDYRLVHTYKVRNHDDSADSTVYYLSDVIRSSETSGKTVSMYLNMDEGTKALKLAKCTEISGGTPVWGSSEPVTDLFNTTTFSEGAGVYKFDVKISTDAVTKFENVGLYTGNYYIKTNIAKFGWASYTKNIMEKNTVSYNSEDASTFNYYYCAWGDSEGTNVKCVVANDYNNYVSDTVMGDAIIGNRETLPAAANVRFSYNTKTNQLKRSYIAGSTNPNDRFLVMIGDFKLFDSNGAAITNSSYDNLNANEACFNDNNNWIYQADLTAQSDAEVYLVAKYNGADRNLYGSSSDKKKILTSTNTTTKYHITTIYDFKTNHLMTAWKPSADAPIEDIISNAPAVMIMRQEQGNTEQITFKYNESTEKNGSIDDTRAYGAMHFTKSTMTNTSLSQSKRGLYWISFPFDVNLKDAFGFGEYNVDWVIEYYDGDARARECYWADSEGFWKFVTPAMRNNGYELKKNVGYVLALDVDRLEQTSASVWDNSVSDIYIYFPSKGAVAINNTLPTSVTVPAHICTETRDTRNIYDSNWNIIGVPVFADQTAISCDANFYYAWNADENSYATVASSTGDLKPMYSYMVQFAGTLNWSTHTATPASVAARMKESPDKNYNLTLMRDSVEHDHTLLRMTEDANVSTAFEFNYDLSKEYNSNKGNIWTVTTDNIKVAGNSQPHPLTTTIVPVGVKIAANGEYTFSMPEGTNGGDVWLIDNANNSRTNLGLMDYTVNLTTGTYEGRFSLEFPVQNVVTEIENAANANANANADVRKVFVGGRLYILRDGKAYDATGAQVR